MALVMLDRVQETTNTTGTGTLTLAGATSGCQTFSNIGNGNTTYYTIYSSPDWEVGIGTYTSAGNTLSRDTVLASSLGGTTKINVASGAFVFGTYPAGRAVYTDASTNLTLPANLTFGGTGARITGDFSNATVANRAIFQTSTTNGGTAVTAIPNGTSSVAAYVAINNSDPTNGSYIDMLATSTYNGFRSAYFGTGTYLPMTFQVGGSERMRIDTSGNVGIGTSTTTDTRLRIKQSADTGGASFSFKVEANANDTGLFIGYRGVGAATAADTCAISASYGTTGAFKPITFLTSDTERMRIDSSGNINIATAGARITGDFSNATLANRLAFQTSTVNSATGIIAYPNGTSQFAGWYGFTSTSANASYIGFSVDGTNTNIVSDRTGTGTYLPMTFYSGGSERMRIDTSGNVGIGTSSPEYNLEVYGTGAFLGGITRATTSIDAGAILSFATLNASSTKTSMADIGGASSVTTAGSENGYLFFRTKSSGTMTERMRITATGEVGIGLTPDGSSLLQIAAGTATKAPLELTAGTLMTTPDSGSVEYDGNLFYMAPLDNRRGICPSEYYYRLNSTFAGANATGAQSIFGVGITLAASTQYEFEMQFVLNKTAGTTSHTMSLLFGGTATLNNILYKVDEVGAGTALPIAIATPSSVVTNVATATSIFSAVTTAARTNAVTVRGTISVNAGGTFIPQYQLSAAPGGAYTTQIGSYIKIKPIGAAGANINVGGWA